MTRRDFEHPRNRLPVKPTSGHNQRVELDRGTFWYSWAGDVEGWELVKFEARMEHARD